MRNSDANLSAVQNNLFKKNDFKNFVLKIRQYLANT